MIRMLRAGNNPRPDRGFSLIEMLVALTIAAVVAASISFMVFHRDPVLAQQVDDIVRQLRLARQAAIREGQAQQVVFDVGTNRVHYADTDVRLAESVGMTVRTSEDQLIEAEVAGLSFFDDASSSGGIILLEDDDRIYEITVIWISGKIRVSDRPSRG